MFERPCPQCGALVGRFTGRCPMCGMSLRGSASAAPAPEMRVDRSGPATNERVTFDLHTLHDDAVEDLRRRLLNATIPTHFQDGVVEVYGAYQAQVQAILDDVTSVDEPEPGEVETVDLDLQDLDDDQATALDRALHSARIPYRWLDETLQIAHADQTARPTLPG